MPGGWTSTLWAAVSDTYAAILRHPFLTGLADGSLDPQAFSYFLAQDAHYLRHYGRALAALAAKAPTHADTGLLAGHAAQTAAVELALHQQLLPTLGIPAETLTAIDQSPTTTAYTSYLLAVSFGASFAEGLAAVLPCYWIYQRVGSTLVQRGSPDVRYKTWIDTYAGEAFAATVADVLALADRVGTDLRSDEAARAHTHFVTTSRYEWMFWDAAWRQEVWPI